MNEQELRKIVYEESMRALNAHLRQADKIITRGIDAMFAEKEAKLDEAMEMARGWQAETVILDEKNER